MLNMAYSVQPTIHMNEFAVYQGRSWAEEFSIRSITPGGRFELPSYKSNRSRVYRLTGLGYPDLLTGIEVIIKVLSLSKMA